MGADLYNSLFETGSSFSGTDSLVAAFAQEGRLRQAAFALANDEMMEGIWVEEEQMAEESMRYAADDRSSSSAVFKGEDYVVQISRSDNAWSALQMSGAPGASLKLDGRWIVLTRDVPTIMELDELPATITLVDLAGREITLTR
jgi:hypothetical protein